MEELLSYRLSDLLLFSEQTFYRQFALYNNWLGPLRYLAYPYGLVILVALSKQRPPLTRTLLLSLTFFWVVCIYGYIYQLYAHINWLAGYLLPLLCVQPLLLLWTAIQAPESTRAYPATILWLMALILPVIELVTGRSLEVLPAFLLTPDSLAICSLALMTHLRRPFWLFLPSLLWLAFSTLSYIALESSLASYLLIALFIVTGSRAYAVLKNKPAI